MDEILFYIREEPYGWLSNFERTPFVVDGKRYLTNEHYFQSQKGKIPEVQEYIRVAPNATIAMGLGRMLEQPIYDKYLVDDWCDAKKLDVMLKGLRCKFKDPRLRQLLLETENAVIHENSATDFFWGIGDDRTGESWLGKLIMQVREEIKQNV